MNRRIFYGFLVAALGVNLFFGAQIYVYSAHASQKDDPYENYKLLADVLEKVRQEYVDGDKVTYQDLIHGALKGMLNSLDPHSEFMDPEKFDELKKETEGEFGGVGIIVEMKDKVLTVLTPMEDSPGFRAGIMPLDQIIKIDGKSAAHFEFEDAVKELHGEPGTSVRLTIRRPSTGQSMILSCNAPLSRSIRSKILMTRSNFRWEPMASGMCGCCSSEKKPPMTWTRR
jgi:carboxyl-terminal processing protease